MTGPVQVSESNLVRVTEARQARDAASSLSLGSAVFLSLLVVVALGALALWPAAPWHPSARPALAAPIVFDRLINLPSPAPADSNASAAAR